MVTPTDTRPFTSGELAARLGVSPRTVARWCRDGLVDACYQTAAGRWRIERPVRLDPSLPASYRRVLEMMGVE